MAEHDIPGDPWSRFVTSVFAMNALILEAGESIASPLGQSSARWQVLGRAWTPQTVAQMARDIGHARQSIQRVADVLVADGLLEFSAHPGDRRTKLAQLTPRGREVLEAIYTAQLAWSAALLGRLDAERLTSAAAALDDIAAVVAAASGDRP